MNFLILLAENNCSSSTSTLVALSSSTHTLTSFSVSGSNDGSGPSVASTNVVSGHSQMTESTHTTNKSSHEHQLDVPITVVPHPAPYTTSSHQATITRRESMV